MPVPCSGAFPCGAVPLSTMHVAGLDESLELAVVAAEKLVHLFERLPVCADVREQRFLGFSEA